MPKLGIIFVIQITISFFVTINALSIKDAACVVSINANFPDKEPILLFNNSHRYEFVIPDEGNVRLQKGQQIVLLCADPKNAVVATNANYTTATCVLGTKFKVLKSTYEFDTLGCRQGVRGEVRNTGKTCGNGNGKIMDIGYQITKTSWLTLIQSCFDESRGESIYSEHILYGGEIGHPEKESSRPDFSTKNFGKIDVKHAYTPRKNQVETFAKLLGSQELANRYIDNKNSFLARGHLAPDGDFLYAAWQFTTYFYVNVCPQWQAINGGNWVSLEETVRKVAEKYGDTFKVFTGTYDVLTLPDARGHETEMYMVPEKKQVPIPKLVWKIMYSEKTKEAIAFVSTNNPFLEQLSKDHVLCSSICQEAGWNYGSWTNLKKGYIYCCAVDELRRKVRTIPQFSVKGLLKGLKA